MGNVRQLKDAFGRAADAREGMQERLQRAAEAFDAGRFAQAAELGAGVARGARSAELKSAAGHMAGVALLQDNRPQQAWEALNLVPAGRLDPTLAGACLLEMGRPSEAVRHLELAVQHGAGPQAWELLAAAHEQCGEHERAAQVRAQAPRPDGGSTPGPDA
jgi:predicted Zn-dependent protease